MYSAYICNRLIILRIYSLEVMWYFHTGLCGNNDNMKTNDIPRPNSLSSAFVSSENSVENSSAEMTTAENVNSSQLFYGLHDTPAHQSSVDVLVSKYRYVVALIK